MDLTRDKFTDFKTEYPVFSTTPRRDELGNVQRIRGEQKSTLYTMWQPVNDAAALELYGERVKAIKRAVLYDDPDVEEGDQVGIGDAFYSVIAIHVYNSHTEIEVERV